MNMTSMGECKMHTFSIPQNIPWGTPVWRIKDQQRRESKNIQHGKAMSRMLFVHAPHNF